MKKIYSVLVENRSGVLCKVAGLFSRRAFNIDSLVVGETDDPSVSCMTLSLIHISTTGGFLKNKNVTLVIGTEDEQVPGALKILKECAGARQSVKYTMPSMSTGSLGPGANSMIPIDMQVGGCTVFVVDVDQYEKF